ncbi:hypothetical protein D3C87_1585290 [compost metagenome]
MFAVYIPPHAPAPGQAFLITPWKSSSSKLPANFCPKASKADTIFKEAPLYFPEWILPPYTIIDGRFKRPIAMIDPGMFLSQPGTVIRPS